MSKIFYWKIATVKDYRLTFSLPVDGSKGTYRIVDHSGGKAVFIDAGSVFLEHVESFTENFYKAFGDEKAVRTQSVRFKHFQILAKYGAVATVALVKMSSKINGQKSLSGVTQVPLAKIGQAFDLFLKGELTKHTPSVGSANPQTI